VASTNLANAQTTRSADGTVFKRRDVLLSDAEVGDPFAFESELDKLRTVEVVEVVEDDAPPKMVYQPNHPDADPNGYVAYPNINTVEEMVNMITTMRSYQANLNILSGFKQMTDRVLGIGRMG
jgi:flagellar basal-body rod protein FlgC